MRRALFLIVLILSTHLVAQINYPTKERLIDGWLFLKGDVGNIWECVRPYEEGFSEAVPIWTEVSLPHCFNATDAVNPDVNYYQGPGWYKTNLEIKNPYPKGRTILLFEGAGQKTEVYVYTTKVASHVGGYDEWQVDITDAVENFLRSDDAKRFAGKIPINIKCDNSRDAEMIPSDLSDFNIYGGLYRYLNLVYLPATSIRDMKLEPVVDKRGKVGKVHITANLDNYIPEEETNIKVEVISPDGKVIHTQELAKKIGSGMIDFGSITVQKPFLWNPDTPDLYTCRMTVSTSSNSQAYEDHFGFRHFEFVTGGPFFLNGKRLLLQGTHRHEDHAGVAAAMSEELIIKEMQMIKAMGANFIRLGHYQQSRIVLEQCDKLGILVWEEIPWCRGGLGGESYQRQAKDMLTNMIAQHHNHPSIILWGLGNENDWPNDFPEFDQQAIRSFMKELHDLAHSLDNSRLTSIRRCDFCKDIVDVYSPSIWAGWYRGIYTDYKRASFNEKQKVNHFLHVEWGGDCHARRHAENPYLGIDKVKTDKTADERAGDASLYGGNSRVSKDGEWSESYICDLIDWHLKEQETMDWLTGTAYWPFKDFSTPVRPENPIPYMNQKGVVERDLTPKETFYVFQSYWSKKPMIHIYGHSWPTRWGNEGEKKTVKVYSNCDEVELFLNGKSVGVKKRNSQNFPAAGLRWEVIFAKGENRLHAISKTKKQSETISDEIVFTYQTDVWTKENKIDIKIIENTADYAWIEAEFKDKNNILCLDSRKFFRFSSIGSGSLVVDQGTCTGSRKLQAYNGRARIKLLKNKGTKTIVAVSADEIETAFIEIN
ncbi:glycoside hydrolase family 2 protein [Bacteroides congonensis]